MVYKNLYSGDLYDTIKFDKYLKKRYTGYTKDVDDLIFGDVVSTSVTDIVPDISESTDIATTKKDIFDTIRSRILSATECGVGAEDKDADQVTKLVKHTDDTKKTEVNDEEEWVDL